MKLGFVVEYCKRPDETDQLDKVLQLSVCILVFILHVSDLFMEFSMFNVYFSATCPFRVFFVKREYLRNFCCSLKCV